MEVITCDHFFIFGIWMVFIFDSFGQQLNRNGVVHYEQSRLNMQRFRSSKYAEVDLSRRAKIREEVMKKRKKRSASSFNDPNWSKQIYLFGTGSIIADHNVKRAWDKGYSGKNVTVAVVDDGLKYTHEDFKGRYRSELSYDYVDNDVDPAPASSDPSKDGHGTNCAGVIAAAADNSRCGVGVAYDVKIAGIRLTSTVLPNDTQVAKAFYPFPGHQIDIFSNSWGPPDTGYIVAGPGPLTQLALQTGTSKGRGGRGSIYVRSAGNGAIFGDNCALDGFVNTIYTIPVAAVDKDARPSHASESCSAVMTSAYSSNLETTSIASNTACDSEFGETSAAAALISGIIALALQARNTLTSRDVQHLVVRSSRSDIIDKSVRWTVNKAGFRVSNRVGFGFLDASLLIRNVENLNSTLPPQRKCEIVHRPEPSWGNFETISLEIEVDRSQCGEVVINHLEHVVAIFDLEYFKRGVIGAYLTSPGGTKSQVLFPRELDALAGYTRYENVTTVSVHFWGEQAKGTWTISIKNDLTSQGTGRGTLFGFSLILYGTTSSPAPSTTRKPTAKPTSSRNKDAFIAGAVVGSAVILCVLIVVVIIVINILCPLWLPPWLRRLLRSLLCHRFCHPPQPAAPDMTAGGENMLGSKVTVSKETNYSVTV